MEPLEYEQRLRNLLSLYYESRTVERIIRRRVKTKRVQRNIEAKRRRRKIYKQRQQEAIRNAFVAPVYLDEIYLRDNKICSLCSLPVERVDASIDHVIPLSKGGLHSPDNVKLAHRKCNSKKGNLLTEELQDGMFDGIRHKGSVK